MLVSSFMYSNNNVKTKKLVIEKTDDCMTVYKATKDACIEQGFSDTAAVLIAGAAYNTCKGKTRTLKQAD